MSHQAAFVIRPLQSKDLKKVTQIYAHYVENSVISWEWAAPDLSEISRRAQELLNQNYPYLVAEQNDTIIGYAYAGPFRSRAAYQWVVESSVYVEKSYWRKGVGRKLMCALCEACIQSGYRTMVAVIAGSDNAGSIGLHEKCGFKISGKIEELGWKQDQWHDWILMSKLLQSEMSQPTKALL